MKMKKAITLFSVSFSMLASAFSLNAADANVSSIKSQLAKMSKEEIREYYLKYHQKVKKTNLLKDYKLSIPKIKSNSLLSNEQKKITDYTELTTRPQDMVIPAEFEENQAIVVSWPYISLDANNQQAYQDFEGVYVEYNQFTQKINLIPITNYPDVYEESDMSYLYLDLVNAIQSEAQVWITVNDLKDTTEIIKFATDNEKPLTNYKFIKAPINSIWYRDCGPIAFYYDNLNKIGYIDFEYPGRPLDDAMPEYIAASAGHALIKSTLEFEGGNTLVNGKNTLFTSTAVAASNSDTEGQMMLSEDKKSVYYIEKTPLTFKNCEDSLRTVMNLSDIQIMPRLVNDGGTGHIDLYADFFDENRFVFSKFPEELKSHNDYNITKTNVDSMLTLFSCNNVKYTNSIIPLPRKNNGKWYSSEDDYARYTRTFTNHLVVNKTIIQPVFYNETSGDKTGDLAAIEEIKKAYPGYKIVQIDMRSLDGSGGSIHCITKQIPADNPIRIFHRPVVKSELISANGKSYYEIKSTIESNKEITSASLFYREKGQTEWKSVQMTKTNGIYIANVQLTATSNIIPIEYYISATASSINKTITKPMTAPDGFYTIDNTVTSVEQGNSAIGMQVYPNPTADQLYAKFNINTLGNYSIQISNELGEELYTNTIENQGIGEQVLALNTELLSAGSYFLIVKDNNNQIQTIRFFVNK